VKIIDAHTHVQSIPGHMWDSPPERLIKLMDDAGIAQSIIMPYGEIRPEDSSLLEETYQAIQNYPDRLMAFARMHPAGAEAGIELFERAITEMGFVGLKFHPVGTLTHPADPSSVAFVKKAVELDVPVLFHCGDEEFTLPFQIAKLLEKIPEAKVIFGHMGGYFHVDDAIQVALEYPGCYLESSACPDPRVIARAIDKVGPERVLFGSDGPGCLPALEVEKIKQLKLGEEVEAQIFHGTIEALLKRS
jgi:uncharacterized protein